jgi:hypothetical protein
MLLVFLFLHLPRFSPEGLTFRLHLHLEDRIFLSLVAPIQLGAPFILLLLVFRFLSEVNLNLGGNLILGDSLNLGGNLRLGDSLNLGGNLNLEAITRSMDKVYMCYNLNFGIFLSKGINNRLGDNILKLILLYPLISNNRIQAL